MPKTRAASAPPPGRPRGGKKTPKARPLKLQGWRSTDEEEIERRRQRGATEPLAVEALDPKHPVFGTFRVSSETGSSYEVEIRSLARPDNSCGCPDFQVNGLGTCKHVEAVLARVRPAKGIPAESPRIEVFLRRTGEQPEVRALWPAGSRRSAAYPLLERFFTANGALRGDPLVRLPALARALTAAPPTVRERVRLSRQILPWIEDERRRAARATSRERLLADVASGREALDGIVKLPLYPYQQEGMLHLAFTERALLADEMGLGKTVQAIAACALLRRLRNVERVLVICPASLKGEWEEQIARFTDLPARILFGTRAQRLRQYSPGAFFYVTNYEQILIDGPDIQQRLAPDVIILDEARRIKNWGTRTAQAVKRLESPYAFVLTGTPLENRIDEIYSILQFLDPTLLGPLFRFNRDFYDLDDRGRPAGYKNLDELHRRLAPVLLRRRKHEVEGQLPGRTDKHYFVPMEEEQFLRYAEYEKKVAQLVYQAQRRPLLPEEMDQLQRWLACMRMLCDTPYILDSECRICPKLGELREILAETLAEPGTKILIFSEWERMLDLVRGLVLEMEAGFAWHTGSVPTQRRRAEIRRFKDDPGCRIFLSTDSGSVGLNLQAANVVINLDLPWNPARLEQRIARAWRKHQTRPVRVVHLVTENSIEQRMISILAGKQALADSVIDGQDGLTDLPLPSGRKALLARLEALTGLTATPPAPSPEPPALERIDPATFEAIERLVEAGILQFTSEDGRVRLHRSSTLESGQDDGRRERQLAAARDLFARAERKIRMSVVLAGGGFPAEALPSLREGVELGLHARARMEGMDLPDSEKVPAPWIEARLPAWLALVRTLRDESETLLGATDDEVRSWIAAGEAFARELQDLLLRFGAEPASE